MAMCRGLGSPRPMYFTALLSFTMFTYFGFNGAFTIGLVTTLQREFRFKSSEIGLFLSTNEIVSLVIITPLAYLGAKRHRPRILGILSLVFAVGCFMFTIPQLFGGDDDHGTTNNVNLTDSSLTTATKSMTTPGLCLPIRDEVDDDDDSCSAAELEASGAQFRRAFWLFLGQALCGIGSAGYFCLGISYMDDGVSKASSSIHVAVVFMAGSLAPAYGFGVSALSLSYHRDFYKIDVDDLGYDDKDPRWIGAWWLGYLIYTGIFIIIACLYFVFPKEWPESKEEADEMKEIGDAGKEKPSVIDERVVKAERPKEENKINLVIEFIKGYIRAIFRLLTNLTFLAGMLAICSELAGGIGFFSFAARYVQTQYDVTPATTSIILGCILTPAFFCGNMIGAVIVKRLNLTIRGMALMCLLLLGSVSVVFPLYFSIGCDNGDIAGVTVPYPGQNETNLEPPCVGNCSVCPTGTYTPVCGSNGVTYITPCHAGCTQYTEGFGTNNSLYEGCSCWKSSQASGSAFNMSSSFTATQGICPRDCSAKLTGFIVLLSAILLVNASSKNPSFMLKLRCVDEDDRALSLGLSSVFTSLLGFIPAPIYFGAAVQSTCLMFQESCGKTGNCFIYDTNQLTNVMFGIFLALKICTLLCYSIAWRSIRKKENGNYEQTQLCISLMMKKRASEE